MIDDLVWIESEIISNFLMLLLKSETVKGFDAERRENICSQYS